MKKERNFYKRFSHKKNMEKEGKKILGFLMLGFIGLIFISGFVSAAPLDDFKSWINNVFSNWKTGGSINEGGGIFLKLLMAIIITLLVFSILDAIGLIENRPALFVISLAVGILGTYYMTVTQVELLANIYTAFGGTLITLLPFIVLASFTIIAIRDGNVQMMVIQHIAWGIFTAFLAYSMWTKDILLTNFIVWVIFGISLFLTIFNTIILDWIAVRLVNARILAAREGMEEARTGFGALRGIGEEAGRVRPRRGRRPW